MTEQKGNQTGWGPSTGLHRFAIIVACLTLVLLVAGGLVTSNEAGDSVPDWPLSFGRWIIGSNNFVANVRYEYSHRVIAGAVGFATFALALWAWIKEKRSWVKWLALAAFAGVVAQAALGGMRVLFPAYKAAIAIPHALIAQSFFALLVSLAVFTSRGWWMRQEQTADSANSLIRLLAPLTIAVVLVQLVLGAGFRHRAFGIIPHISGAFVVTILLVATAVTVLVRHAKDRYLRRPALVALALLVVQLGLGIGAYLARLASGSDPLPLEPMISLTVAHLAVGALLLATVMVLTLRCYRVLAPRSENEKKVADPAAELASTPRRATA